MKLTTNKIFLTQTKSTISQGTFPKRIKTEEELEIERIANAKEKRASDVASIIVEVDGMKFDGDETSQDRMARSIVALNENETVQWVLADNTIAQVTKEQLRQALRLAGEAQTAIWANPYIKKETTEE